MISGKTNIIAHLGYPTESFKAPLIYKPYFESIGVDAIALLEHLSKGGPALALFPPVEQVAQRGAGGGNHARIQQAGAAQMEHHFRAHSADFQRRHASG